MNRAPRFATAIMATRKQDDAGDAPICLHVVGPQGATKVYARLTLAAAKATVIQLTLAIDAIEREAADAKYAEAIR